MSQTENGLRDKIKWNHSRISDLLSLVKSRFDYANLTLAELQIVKKQLEKVEQELFSLIEATREIS